MKTRMLIVLCLILSTPLACGCGGGGTETPYAVTFIKANGAEVTATIGEVAYPMTLGSSFRVTFAEAITDAAGRTAIEGLIALTDPNGEEVEGAFSWSDDFTQLIFTPSRRLGYGKVYTVNLNVSSTAAAVALTKQIAEGQFQFKTMLEGDTNGDGYAEVTVGAYGWDAGGGQSVYTGACFVYNGSVDGPATTYTRRLMGETGDGFCMNWDTADVNGDGYADFFAGAPWNGSNVGAIRVYYGSADGIPETANATIAGDSSAGDGNFGSAVAKAGDVNGDGFGDIIVGSPRHDEAGAVDAGAVYVFLGSAAGITTTPSTSLFGTNTNEWLGSVVASAGDVNGDGYDDVVANALTNAGGEVYVHLGSADGVIATAATTLTGEGQLDFFGASLAPGGDINGDGFDDVVVGARRYDSGTGAVYIYNGSESGISTNYSTRLVGPGGDFGYCAHAGDVNGDGYDDLMVGAPVTSSMDGAAFFFMGSADGIVETASSQWSGSGGEFLGITIPGRDANGDGFYDIIIGAPFWNTSVGKVQIYNGSSDGPGSTAIVRTGENPYDWYSLTFELN